MTEIFAICYSLNRKLRTTIFKQKYVMSIVSEVHTKITYKRDDIEILDMYKIKPTLSP